MKTIGLTGGIGSGKSEVARVLRKLGAWVISADDVSHEVYRHGTEGWREVVETFGEGVVADDGEIDRSRLGAIVFGDPEKLAGLNRIVHPRTRLLVQEQLDEVRTSGTAVAVVEVPLLLEAGWEDLVDEVWVTTVSEGEAVVRAAKKRGLDEGSVRARMRAQMPDVDRVARADVVLHNSGSLGDLKAQVTREWHERILTDDEHRSPN